jgi:WD40 repeat protein
MLRSLANLPSPITALAFSPAGDQLAVATQTDLQLFTFEAPSTLRRRASLLSQVYMVWSVAFSGNGQRLAACTGNQAIHAWDVGTLTRKTITAPLPDRLTSVACSHDGIRVAFGHYSGVIYLWAPDGDAPPERVAGNDASISSLAFAPGGGTLVSAGEWSGPLKLHHLATGNLSRVPVGGSGRVSGFGFLPSGRVLGAACEDGRVRFWEVECSEGEGGAQDRR